MWQESRQKGSQPFNGGTPRAFWDSNQAEDVIFHIMKINPERILILGTSDRMVQKIAATLKLPAPSRYIHIEDVAKPEEIAQANYARHKEGKHVIPVPTMELRPYFKGYLVDPLQFFRNRRSVRGKRRAMKSDLSSVRYSVIMESCLFKSCY